jgi:hypothetical protein
MGVGVGVTGDTDAVSTKNVQVGGGPKSGTSSTVAYVGS